MEWTVEFARLQDWVSAVFPRPRFGKDVLIIAERLLKPIGHAEAFPGCFPKAGGLVHQAELGKSVEGEFDWSRMSCA